MFTIHFLYGKQSLEVFQIDEGLHSPSTGLVSTCPELFNNQKSIKSIILMDALEFIKNNVNCCISGKPLKDSIHVNMIDLEMIATWKYPVSKNLFIKNYPDKAIAFVHDDYIIDGKITGEIKHAVELDGTNVVYHPYVENAKRICRVCGCSETDACYHEVHGNCSWVEWDLCSHCNSYPGEAKRYSQILQ